MTCLFGSKKGQIHNYIAVIVFLFGFGIISIITGITAKKEKDTFGKNGITLGILATIIGSLQVAAWYIYVYTSIALN